MIRVYADFNAKDEKNRVCLDTADSLKDIEKHKPLLKDGLEVILYSPGDFEVAGKLIFDEGIWKGIADLKTIKYYDEKI
jgi:hypothetical protein